MLSKRKLVNALFMAGFPVYGIGTYLMFDPAMGWSLGLLFASSPFTAIILFHLVDLLYRRRFAVHVGPLFWLCCAVILSFDASVLMGLHYRSPVLIPANAVAIILQCTVPYLAAVIVQVYNRDVDGFDWSSMLMKCLFALIGINLLGMGAGLHNKLHSFEGRASFPFVLGIYEAAHLLAFVNLVLLFYMRDVARRPVRFALMLAFYLLNLAIIMSVNSRLSFMVFFVMTVLVLVRAVRAVRGLYWTSLFTMPIMVSFALLIYEVLSLPFFTALLSRVDKKDVTTYNGRTYIWESAWDWATTDGRGLLLGNGYNGQYRLHLLEYVAKLWGADASYNLHMHSAFLEFFVNQGIVGVLLMYWLYWQAMKHCYDHYRRNTAMAPLYGGLLYLLFVWQIDITGYGYYLGFTLLLMIMAPLSIKASAITGKRTDLDGRYLS